MYALYVKDLSFRFPGEKENIFEKINFEIKSGSVIAITGKSGSGKSTLCRILCGIIPRVIKGELNGDIKVFGEDLKDMTSEQTASMIGIVFQDPDSQLFLPVVEDELAFAPENFCVEREDIGTRIERSLKATGITELRYSVTSSLSGGQKQLAAVASVLTMNPKILILDEAMSQLDTESTGRIKKLIGSLKNEGMSVILIKHDRDNLDVADEIYVLTNGKLEKERDLND